jgi:ABC-type branched-subunit amino acid transport system ATPase component
MAWVIGDLRTDAAMTVVLVEQHAELALKLAPHCLVMDRGRIVYDGPSATLARDPRAAAEPGRRGALSLCTTRATTSHFYSCAIC